MSAGEIPGGGYDSAVTAGDTFARWGKEWDSGAPNRTFALRLLPDGRLAGCCELRVQPDGSAHGSYWTLAPDRGHGYASRGLALLLAYARSAGIAVAEAHIAGDNYASRRVAEKAGLSSRGRARIPTAVPCCAT